MQGAVPSTSDIYSLVYTVFTVYNYIGGFLPYEKKTFYIQEKYTQKFHVLILNCQSTVRLVKFFLFVSFLMSLIVHNSGLTFISFDFPHR